MTRPEAIVVGAGPAGSMAALVLARAGVPVRLLERGTFPRPKLCGDTLNPGSMAILERLGGGPDAPAERIRARALPLSGMTVTGPGSASVSADYPGGLAGMAITRDVLDPILAEAAVAAGASFDTNIQVLGPVLSNDGARVTGVMVANSGGRAARLDAPMVIAADGRASRLASSMRLARFARTPRRWAFGAYFEGVAGLTSRGEMHVRRGGYIGVAPLPGGIANVCVVREESRVDQRAVVRESLAADARLRDRFAGARQVSETTVLGPLAVEAVAAGCPGLLLAGDAAGFVDPMTGDGLRFALSGGELAGLAALDELATGRPAWQTLGAERARLFSTKWRINRALRAVVGSGRALDAAALVARRWPASVQYLIGVAGDVAVARGSR